MAELRLRYPRYSASGYIKKPYRLDEQESFSTDIVGYTAFVDGVLLTEEGTLLVYPGFCWDMATGALDTPDMVVASLAHDAVCELIDAGKLPWSQRSKGDALFRRTLIRYGCSSVRAWAAWSAVRGFSVFKRYTKWLF